MQLDLKTIKSITKGAVRITNDNGFRFYRFTTEQENQYKKFHDRFLNKTYSTTGVCMDFLTDTNSIFMDIDFSESTTRKYYAFDIFCDNKKISEVTNFCLGDDLFNTRFELKNVKKEIILPEGEKHIKIVFPWSVVPTLNEIRIDDESYIRPALKKDIMLFFGDSITQGYDARYPSESYVYRLSELMNVDVYNKAIGGEVFFPELLEYNDDFIPKYISVAYGSNDWNGCTYEDFEKNCFLFYQKLSKLYPQSKIFALTPVWRKDIGEYRKFGDFDNVGKCIKKVVNQFENVVYIDCYDFIPHDAEEYFADKRLHPNSKGFDVYSQSLFGSIKRFI